MVRITTRASVNAKPAPMQRWMPPPKGIQVYVPGRLSRKRSGRLAAHEQIASVLCDWHESARAARAGSVEVPPTRYAAAVGAVHDLVFHLVASGRTSEVPALEEVAYGAIAALLRLSPP
jgi:hypothetical protein